MERLGVWAERYEGFVRVGTLALSDEVVRRAGMS